MIEIEHRAAGGSREIAEVGWRKRQPIAASWAEMDLPGCQGTHEKRAQPKPRPVKSFPYRFLSSAFSITSRET